MNRRAEDDEPFPGLAVHLQGLRLDKGVRERIKNRLKPDFEELPTDPAIPSAKLLRLNAGKCVHGLSLEACEECSLLLEHGGRYSVINPDDQEGEGEEG
jgi:hypothetical protein